MVIKIPTTIKQQLSQTVQTVQNVQTNGNPNAPEEEPEGVGSLARTQSRAMGTQLPVLCHPRAAAQQHPSPAPGPFASARNKRSPLPCTLSFTVSLVFGCVRPPPNSQVWCGLIQLGTIHRQNTLRPGALRCVRAPRPGSQQQVLHFCNHFHPWDIRQSQRRRKSFGGGRIR